MAVTCGIVTLVKALTPDKVCDCSLAPVAWFMASIGISEPFTLDPMPCD